MFRLTRTVRFCINADPDQPAPSRGEPANSFAGYPSMRGLGRYYELEVACSGEVKKETGYFLNIKEVDKAVRAEAVPLIARACAQAPRAEPAVVLGEVLGPLDRALGGRVAGVRWRLTPYYSVEMSPRTPDTALIRQQFDFAASHRLNVPSASEAENRALFGKCNYPGGHGHNYRVEPCVEVRLRPGGVPAFGLAELEALASRAVIARFDHKNLNQDTPEFGSAGLNPSVENIAKVCFDLLEPEVRRASADARLKSITVWETEKTSCTYPA